MRVNHQRQALFTYQGVSYPISYFFPSIYAHAGVEVKIQRAEDGLFYCLCGKYSVRNPDTLRQHFKASCAPQDSSPFRDETMSRSPNTSIDCSEQLLIPDDPKSGVSQRVHGPNDAFKGIDNGEARCDDAMGPEDDRDDQSLGEDLGSCLWDKQEFVGFRM